MTERHCCFAGIELCSFRVLCSAVPHAQFAFLSACQTATGDEILVAQEAVDLAAGMLSVGFRGVIGTMWSMMVSDGPVVADEVYSHLLKEILLELRLLNIRRSEG